MVGKLKAIGTPWLFGLPAIIYLILAAWTELGLPFPVEGFQLPQVTRFDGYGDDNIFPLHESFRHIASPVALAAIVIGLSFALIRAIRPLSPVILTSLVVIAYVTFLGWDAYISNSDCRFSFGSSLIVEFGQAVGSLDECYEPAGYLRDLRVHTDEHSPLQAFSMTAEALAIIALLAMSSIWAGFGVAKLVQQHFRAPVPSSKGLARKTKALLLGSAVCLGIMVVFAPAVYGEITESSATMPPDRVGDPVSAVKLEMAGRWPFFGFPFAVTAGMIDGDPYAFLGVGSSQAGIMTIDMRDPGSPAQVGEMLIPRTGPVIRRGSDLFLAEKLLYVADATGLHIVDVSDPSLPKVLGFLDLPEAQHSVLRISVDGGMALLAAGSSGAFIVDVTDPANPRLIGTLETPGPNGGPADSTESVYLQGDLAFLADERAGLRIIDIANPASPKELGAFATKQFTQDVADVFVQGDHAFVVAGGDVQVLNISVPTDLRAVGSLEIPDNRSGQQVYVQGNLAFLVGSWDLRVIDISNLAAPKEVGFLTTQPHFIRDIFVQGDLAFLADAGGFRAVDISDPTLPKTDGSLRTPERIFAVGIQGTHAYVAAVSAGLRVVDITDISAPIEVGHLDIGGAVVDVAVQGQHTFIVEGDEFPGPASAEQGLRVIDISKHALPREVGSLFTPGEARGIVVRGDIAFVADGTEGLRIIDISNPTSPREISSQNTPGSAVDLFIQSNHAYIADGEDGLRIIDISNPASPKNAGNLKSLRSTEAVHVQGELAFVNDTAGLRVVDVSKPSSPKPVGFIPLPGGGGKSISAQGDHVFLGDSGALRVIDISDPAFPRVVGSLENLESPGSIVVEGDLAYVAYQSGVAIIRTAIDDGSLP